MKTYKKNIIVGLALSLALSLTACDNINESELYNNSQENIENSQTENEPLYEEIDLKKEYSYLDLYVINTGKFGAETPTYYICEKEGFYNTALEETAYYCQKENCYFAEEDLKKKYQCYAVVYKTVGLEEEQTFYETGHYPKDYYGEIYLAINDYLFILESPGGTDYDASETELFQIFEDSIVDFYRALKFEDLREEYTVADLIELMNLMNSGEYEFNEEYVEN